MLELMKKLLEITDDIKDDILEHYILKAQNIIKGYCCIDEIPEQYESITVDYAVYLYKNRNAEGIQSQTQGSRSINYINDIPESIRLALPKPKVKVG